MGRARRLRCFKGIVEVFASMSIRRKFFGFGGFLAVAALLIGAIGCWGIIRQTGELESVAVTAQALRNHLESDMMHDALRAATHCDPFLLREKGFSEIAQRNGTNPKIV
jgi:hypothetical protein